MSVVHIMSQIQTNKTCQKHLKMSLLAQKYERIIEICCLKHSIFLKHFFFDWFWLISSSLPVWTASLHNSLTSCDLHVFQDIMRYIIYFYHIGFVRLPVYLISQCWFFACKQRPELFFLLDSGSSATYRECQTMGQCVCVGVCVLCVGGCVML